METKSNKWVKQRQEKLKKAKEFGYNSYNDAIAGLYRKFKSSCKVADIFQVHDTAIRYRLEKMGIPRSLFVGPRSKGMIHPQWKEAARYRHDTLMSYRVVGERFQMSASSARKYYEKWRTERNAVA